MGRIGWLPAPALTRGLPATSLPRLRQASTL